MNAGVSQQASQSSLIRSAHPISGPLPGLDPFIVGMYHQDLYPRGNGRLGPDAALLEGRKMGMDFSRQEGWSMYHGDDVPGFPAHPHRGFETVTIVRKGLVDHADSLGATARYGEGDVQWLTTGAGVQHAEMFPMVHEDKGNTLDLFQLWLNLPAKSKMAAPDFSMFWAPDIPHVNITDGEGRRSEVQVVAGDYVPVDVQAAGGTGRAVALKPPPASWASEAGADLAIWIARMEPGASLTLPAASAGLNRALYLTRGSTLTVDGHRFDQRVMLVLESDHTVPLRNEGDETLEILMLQGRPIGEPVAAAGPFVMNTQQELQQAIDDYRRTEFGGWPWPSHAHTHGREERFARHPDGRVERPRKT